MFALLQVGGSDEDTLPMIYVFEARIADGRFVSSRFTGYPIPELGIGILLFWKLGCKFINIYFYLIGVFIFYLSLNKILIKKFRIFLTVMFVQSCSLFRKFRTNGLFMGFFIFFIRSVFFIKKILEIAVLMFGFSIGCRINFLIFCLVSIYFYI